MSEQNDAVASARKAGLWVPGQALDKNVGLMAWRMYMAWWEVECSRGNPEDAALSVPTCCAMYEHCIEIAKALEVLNHPEREPHDERAREHPSCGREDSPS